MTNSTGDSETGRSIQRFLYLNRSPSVFPAEYKRNARPDVSRTIRLHLVKEIIKKKKRNLDCGWSRQEDNFLCWIEYLLYSQHKQFFGSVHCVHASQAKQNGFCALPWQHKNFFCVSKWDAMRFPNKLPNGMLQFYLNSGYSFDIEHTH